MSRGDELRRLIRISQRLASWVSPGTLAAEEQVDRATVHRILAGIHDEVGLLKRRSGRRVEYRLTTPAERASR